MKHTISLLVLCAALFMTACDSNDLGKLEALLISNLPADPPTSYGSMGQPLGTTGKYTLFSFATGEAIPNSDSLTNKWDIGFRATSIIINGGTNRIGTGGVQLVNGVFEDLKTAPESGYLTDDGNTLAVNSDWYTYNPTARTVTPNAGKVFMIKTATGKYAKMEIVSYYLDAPASPTMNNPSRYYTFKYVYQKSGSRNF